MSQHPPPGDGEPREGAVQGYDETSYGEAMAEVYDDWYPVDDADTDAAVRRLRDLSGDGPVLELGVGTGRLAIPLAQSGLEVHGIDGSPAMLARLAAKDGGPAVHAHRGDMAKELPDSAFSLIFVAVNTFFGITTAAAQRAAFAAIASRLAPGGRFVLEAFVPAEGGEHASLTVRSVTADVVVLTASVSDPSAQTATGHFVELRDGQPVRLRPFHLRYAGTTELDGMAEAAGLVLEGRSADWTGTPFGPDSTQHVTVWRRPQ